MMENNKKLRVIIFLMIGAVLVAGFGVWFFYKAPIKPIVDNRPAAIEEKMLNNASEEEIAAIKGKSDIEIEAEFKKEREKCSQDFNGIENKGVDEIKKLLPQIFKINFPTAENFLMCLGVKEGKADECSLLPNDSQRSGECQKTVILFSKTIFPSLRAGSCSQGAIRACDFTGEKDCQGLCSGLILSKEQKDCENLPDNSFAKITCLAINQNDINLCNALADRGDLSKCQNNYYFIKAARTNDLSYLSYLVHRGIYSISQLYFNSDYDCRKPLEKLGEKCSDFYTQSRLQLLYKTAHDLNNKQ